MKQNCHHYQTCQKPVSACTSKCGEFVERVCGNCAFFTGEECNGPHEGAERYNDSEACASFEPNAPADLPAVAGMVRRDVGQEQEVDRG